MAQEQFRLRAKLGGIKAGHIHAVRQWVNASIWHAKLPSQLLACAVGTGENGLGQMVDFSLQPMGQPVETAVGIQKVMIYHFGRQAALIIKNQGDAQQPGHDRP